MIESESIAGGRSFRLPPRRLPRAIGAVLIVIGVTIGSFMFFWMSGPMGWFDHMPTPVEVEKATPDKSGFEAAGIAFAMLGLPGLLFGVALVFAGVILVAGLTRCSLEVDEQEVRCREQIGWMRWTWRLPVPAVRALGVVAMNGSAVRANSDDDGDLGALLVRNVAGPDRWWAVGYPMALLQRLAAEVHPIMRPRVGTVVIMSDPATGAAPGDLLVEDDGPALVIRVRQPWWTTRLRLGTAFAAIVVVTAWSAAWYFGWGVGMVAGFVSVVAVMTVVPALIGRWQTVRSPAMVRVSGGVVDTSSVIGASSFPAVHQAHPQELGDGSNRYRAISLRDGDNQTVGELRWPGNRVTQAWIARRISWFLEGRRGDVLSGTPSVSEVPAPPAPIVMAGTGAVVEAVLLPHPACRGQVVFGGIFAGFAIGIGSLIWVVAGELPVVAIPITGVFVLGGGSLVWWGLRSSTRRTALRLRDGVLAVEQRDWCSRLERTIAAADVVTVRAEATGTRINDWTVHRLRLTMRDGTRLDLGNQAEPEQIKRVAGELAQSLGVAVGTDH